MGNRDRSPVRPRHPVNPEDLFRRLSTALGGDTDGVVSPDCIVNQSFPEISSLTSVSGFRDQYLLREVLRKYPGFDLGIDTRKCAVSSFLEDERLNRQTNDRLMDSSFPLNRSVRRVFDLACRKAVGVLGRFSVDEFVRRVRFGPGSTTSLPRREATEVMKLSSSPHVTSRCRPIAGLILNEFPLWKRTLESYGQHVVVHNTDKLTSVPKNAKTDRTIGIGPDLNVALQLALGSCIRARLFRHGIDLSDQSINQRRAHMGSVSGELATLDLKSASNSVTPALVWRMLGNHSSASCDLTWYNLLDTLRVDSYVLDGETRRYELFSAMGNGATFEVESLIFWSLCASTCEILGVAADVTVYGDDLIVPVASVPLLVEVLQYAGFRLNDDKSFWQDPPSSPRFRESCGKHYLDGYDVTPFYVTSPLTTVDSIILAANNLVRWAKLPDYGRDARVLPVYLWLISHLPEKVRRARIPYGPENDGLLCDFDEATPRIARLSECRTPIGYRCNVIRTRYIENWSVPGDLGYVVDRLHASQRGFKPPRTRDGLHFKPISLRTPGKPECLEYGVRVVTDWPVIGPWLCNESLIYPTWVDLALWMELVGR